MRIFYGALVVLVALSLSGFAFIYSGVYNVTATEEHSDLSRWALHTTMENSVQARAEDISVPGNFASEEMIRQGAKAYDQLCAACHLKPGKQTSLLRQGLNPTPPSLLEEGHFGPEEQFWVIKNGIKMTGMPAWGNTHDDKDLWELTAFVQELPGMNQAQYQRLVHESATGADDGHDHEHGNMTGMMGHESSYHGEPGHHDNNTVVAESSHHDGMADHHLHESDHHDVEPDHHQDTEEPAAQSSDDHYADGHTH
ncbi:c-type cytochrome [Marinobacter halodurans]|nr:cytochrome c [Marinobacter halodurans]